MKNQYFRRYKKSTSDHHYNAYSYYRKLVKTTVKTNRLCCLNSMDDDLKTQPKNFWNYVSKFKKNDYEEYHLLGYDAE
jgi:hypothetical protein